MPMYHTRWEPRQLHNKTITHTNTHIYGQQGVDMTVKKDSSEVRAS